VRGGLEGHVDDLAAAQARSGHDVHVATLTPAPTPTDGRVTCHVVRAASTDLLPHADADRPFHPPLPDPRARRELGRLLDRVRPDVVHAHSWLGISVPRRNGVPMVLTAHDFAIVCQLHTLLRPDGSTCAGPSPLACVSCARQRDGLLRAALLGPATALGRRRWRVDRIITLSEHVARMLRPHLQTPIEVCGGLVAPTLDGPPPAELPSEPFVLFAGDPSTHKGVDVLLEAWQRPELRDIRLVIAASRPMDRPVGPGVSVVHLPRPAMAAAWRAATLAVVPSVWAEPFGMVAMEALAAGTPVVASDIGALPEVVRDGVDGVLVRPGDSGALASAVTSLLGDPARLAALSSAARAGAERFTPESLVTRIDAVYERAIGSRVKIA
jgi:glycosyltransferase involved in cell wall biosynthesis